MDPRPQASWMQHGGSGTALWGASGQNPGLVPALLPPVHLTLDKSLLFLVSVSLSVNADPNPPHTGGLSGSNAMNVVPVFWKSLFAH